MSVGRAFIFQAMRAAGRGSGDLDLTMSARRAEHRRHRREDLLDQLRSQVWTSMTDVDRATGRFRPAGRGLRGVVVRPEALREARIRAGNRGSIRKASRKT